MREGNLPAVRKIQFPLALIALGLVAILLLQSRAAGIERDWRTFSLAATPLRNGILVTPAFEPAPDRTYTIMLSVPRTRAFEECTLGGTISLDGPCPSGLHRAQLSWTLQADGTPLGHREGVGPCCDPAGNRIEANLGDFTLPRPAQVWIALAHGSYEASALRDAVLRVTPAGDAKQSLLLGNFVAEIGAALVFGAGLVLLVIALMTRRPFVQEP